MRYLALIALALLVACSHDEEAATADSPTVVDPVISSDTPPAVESVVVYATYDDREYLTKLFTAFTDETGIPVTVRHGKLDVIMADVLESRVTPYADVVLLPSVNDVWLLAEEGALRPLKNDIAKVPPAFKDPDGFWISVGGDYYVVVTSTQNDAPPTITDVTELADPIYKDRICLPSSGHRLSQNLIAELIARNGSRETELVVRGWVNNLARVPFADEGDLLEALASGECEVGVVSFTAAQDYDHPNLPEGDIVLLSDSLPPLGIDSEAVGINRHAKNPEAAQRLVAWVFSDPYLFQHNLKTGRQTPIWFKDMALPMTQSRLAQLNEDAVKLAERARYR